MGDLNKNEKRILELFEECSDSNEDLEDYSEEEGDFSSDDNVDDPEYINSGDSDNSSDDDDTTRNGNEDHQVSDDDDSETLQDEDQWTTTYSEIQNFNFDDSSTGCQIAVNTPREAFEHFFSDDIFELLVESTNTYGERLCITNGPKTRCSRIKHFKPIDSTEFLKFFGLCLLQGQIRFPKIRNLFSKHHLYYHPVFPSTMSGRRFEQILRCLNVNPQLGETNMRKIHSFVKLFIEKCQSAYKPKKNLSLDESLLLFRGRLSFRQYIKNKKWYCNSSGVL